MEQIEMIRLEDLVPSSHRYRQFAALWNFSCAKNQLKTLETSTNYKGYGVIRLFKCILLQFMEDLSDRELEIFIQENTAARWFCGFNLLESTPDYSLFSKFRTKVGTNRLSKIFAKLRTQLKQQGYMNEVFNFVDASHLIAKANLWKERDQAIKAKLDKLNGSVEI